jgi:hypothetical protein
MMTHRLLAAAAALALMGAGPALAQMQSTPPAPAGTSPDQAAPPAGQSSAPSSSPDTSSAPTGSAADTSGTASAGASLTKGMTVKDSAGATVGKITAVSADQSGGQVATIKMDADSFTMTAQQLQVQNGVAVASVSKADIQSQLHPGGARKTPQ